MKLSNPRILKLPMTWLINRKPQNKQDNIKKKERARGRERKESLYFQQWRKLNE